VYTFMIYLQLFYILSLSLNFVLILVPSRTGS
jgi:hypothetical protein